jgi:hypothetical protein
MNSCAASLPRTQFGGDTAPFRAVLVPPEDRRDRPPQFLGRGLSRSRTCSISGSHTAHATSDKISHPLPSAMPQISHSNQSLTGFNIQNIESNYLKIPCGNFH